MYVLINEVKKRDTFQRKREQDKESGQNDNFRDSDKRETRFPSYDNQEVNLKKKEAEKSVDRHIRICDITLLEQIDKIMEYHEYKSFSKVISEALYIALPKILERLEGKEEITLPKEEPRHISKAQATEEEFYGTVVRLLKEVVMNVVINKSILSSLLHAKEYDNRKLSIDNEQFANGLMSDTPEYLDDFGVDCFKKLRR